MDLARLAIRTGAWDKARGILDELKREGPEESAAAVGLAEAELAACQGDCQSAQRLICQARADLPRQDDLSAAR